MRLRALGAGCAVLLCAVPAGAEASVLSTTVTTGAVQARDCIGRPAPEGAPGVVQQRVRTQAAGLLQARLAAPSGDWDVAVFDAADGRLVAGAAGFGATELAEGVTAGGRDLLVQACRRSGDAASADLRVDVVPVGDPSEATTIKLVEVAVPTPGAKRALAASGLDLTEHARAGFQEVLLHDARDERRLRELKLPFTVEIDDVVKADRMAMSASAGPQDAGELPSGRTQYRRLPDFQVDMKALVEEHPGLVKPITLPEKTLEGRAVEGIEISQDVAAADGKPVFLQMGVHHAREWPSAEMPMEWAIELVRSAAAGDERATRLLAETRVIVVPIINPDGYNLSRESMVDLAQPVVDPGFAYKRKNCRLQDGAIPVPGDCGKQENRRLGTDPNRNYGGFWGGGGAAAEDTRNDTYRGAGPFSEPETQNVRWLVSTRQVVTLITNHTYSDLVLRPPGLFAEGDPPDEPVYKALGDAMAAENGYTSQKSFELYDTTGTTEDWSYYATGGLGFTFEIGKAVDGVTLAGVGFHPAYPIGVVAEYYGKYPGGGGNREAYYVAAESTADRARHSVLEGRAPAGATLRLTKTFDTYTSKVVDGEGVPGERIVFEDRLETAMTVPSSGAFSWHVNPSTRPFAKKARVDAEPADTPAFEQAFAEDVILPPNPSGQARPGKEIPFEVTPEASQLIAAKISGGDGDDYDLYLFRGDQQVASSTSSGSDEAINYEEPTPGQYTLVVTNWAAKGPVEGTLAVFGRKPGSEKPLPFGTEAWTLTCEVGGQVVATQDVVIDRGEAKAVQPCGAPAEPGTGRPDTPGKPADPGRPADPGKPAGTPGNGPGATRGASASASAPRMALAVDRRRLATALRRGLRARVRCSPACSVVATSRVDGRTAKRLGLGRSASRSVVVACGRLTRAAGRRTFTLRFTKAAQRRLRGAVRLTTTATGRSAGRTVTQRARLTLR